jgi:hypothetical protein
MGQPTLWEHQRLRFHWWIKAVINLGSLLVWVIHQCLEAIGQRFWEFRYPGFIHNPNLNHV